MNSSSSQHESKSLMLLVEQFGPIVFALLTLVVLSWYSDEVVANFSSGSWKAGDLFSAVFGWSSIQTGFAFGVYGFIAGKQDGFVKALQGTITMERFIGYVKRANIAGFLLSMASIPLIVLSPSIANPWSWSFVLVSLWFGLFVWAFCSFLRLAYNFGQLSSVRDKEFHGA